MREPWVLTNSSGEHRGRSVWPDDRRPGAVGGLALQADAAARRHRQSDHPRSPLRASGRDHEPRDEDVGTAGVNDLEADVDAGIAAVIEDPWNIARIAGAGVTEVGRSY
jgi:hypothetical protein